MWAIILLGQNHVGAFCTRGRNHAGRQAWRRLTNASGNTGIFGKASSQRLKSFPQHTHSCSKLANSRLLVQSGEKDYSTFCDLVSCLYTVSVYLNHAASRYSGAEIRSSYVARSTPRVMLLPIYVQNTEKILAQRLSQVTITKRNSAIKGVRMHQVQRRLLS